MTRLHAGPEKVRSPYLRVRFTMSYRNNDRDGSRRREDRNHRPFRGGGGRGGRLPLVPSPLVLIPTDPTSSEDPDSRVSWNRSAGWRSINFSFRNPVAFWGCGVA